MNTPRPVAIWSSRLDPNHPLEPSWYVDFDRWVDEPTGVAYGLRGRPALDLLVETIRLRAEMGEPSTQLFTGFRGSGKTTELRRVAEELRAEATVLHFDAREFLAFHRAQSIEELALGLAAGIGQTAQAQLGDDPALERALTGKKPVFERIHDFLSQEVEATGIQLPLGPGANIKFQIKQGDEDFGQRLKRLFATGPQRLTDFLHNQVVAPIAAGIHPRPLVVIVDGLEKYDVPFPDAAATYRAIASLYSSQAGMLKLPSCHTIYSVPPLVTALDDGISRHYDSSVVTLTSVKVHDPPPAREPFEPGRRALAKALRARINTAALFGADADACVGLLVDASGGHVRDLLRVTREVIRAGGGSLPIPIDAVRETIEWESGGSGISTKAVSALLSHVADGGGLRDLDDQQLGALAIALDQYLVLGYANGRVWYDVHPLAKAKLSGEPRG
jgi:hypothetical protein